MSKVSMTMQSTARVARAQVLALLRGRPVVAGRTTAAFLTTGTATWTSIGTPISAPVGEGSYYGIASLNLSFAVLYTTVAPCTLSFRVLFSNGATFDPSVSFVIPIGGPYLFSKTIEFPIGVIPTGVSNVVLQYNDVAMGHGLDLTVDYSITYLPNYPVTSN